jgi:hypothetical protein
MNAGQAFTLVADFVEADENSRDKVWRILRLACNHAWGKGKWWGMTADFWCKVLYEDGPTGKPYILSPPGYDALLGVNKDGKPRILRDSYFMFHKNGPGDIKGHNYCNWNTDVYDAGHVPTLHAINNYGCQSGVMIGVRAIGKPGEDEFVTIQGETEDGNLAISYELNNKATCNCLQATDDGTTNAVRTVQGLRIKVTEKFEYVDNVLFKNITSITKTLTRTPIEVIFINKKGEGFITARLNPWDIESKYRKYYVPEGCESSVHGLFKIGKQVPLVDESQQVIIGNEEALLALCKGIHLLYYKEQAVAGAGYLQAGIISLEEEMRETQSPIETPIQVVGMYAGEDIPDIMKYH